jgi:hypothetical protein
VTRRSPARKVLAILAALAVGGVALWLAAGVVVMSGTKASFTFVEIKSKPGAGSAATKTTTSTSATPTTTTSTRP